MPMPTLRRMWTAYKRTVLQEGFGLSRRDPAQLLAQDAFYMGARSVLHALATHLERGDVEEAHRFIAREGRRIRALRGLKARAVRH